MATIVKTWAGADGGVEGDADADRKVRVDNSPPSQLTVGLRVKVHGLIKSSEYNGLFGIVSEINQGKVELIVQVDDAAEITSLVVHWKNVCVLQGEEEEKGRRSLTPDSQKSPPRDPVSLGCVNQQGEQAFQGCTRIAQLQELPSMKGGEKTDIKPPQLGAKVSTAFMICLSEKRAQELSTKESQKTLESGQGQAHSKLCLSERRAQELQEKHSNRDKIVGLENGTETGGKNSGCNSTKGGMQKVCLSEQRAEELSLLQEISNYDNNSQQTAERGGGGSSKRTAEASSGGTSMKESSKKKSKGKSRASEEKFESTEGANLYKFFKPL